MKIVLLDGYVENPGDLSWEPLAKLGELTVHDRTSQTESPVIGDTIGDADIIVTNKTPISAATIDRCPNLKLIAVLATGYNVIDYQYAKKKGIPVVNVPAYGTQIVAQYTVGMLLEICAHYQRHSDTVKEGKWQNNIEWCYWDYPMIELSGKTAGIIGLGRIGQASAAILRSLGMRVIAYSRTEREEGKAYAGYVALDTLLAESDVILLHCPLFPETKEIIRRETIAKMKDGVIILNTGRGGLVNERDLAEALNSGKVYAAGVDVVSTEPISADNPLLKAKNILITPHVAWAAREARQRILDTTADNIRAFLDGKPVNVVNL